MLMVSDMITIARDGTPAAMRAERFEQRAPVIVWNICRHCDLSCPHCYIAAGPRPSRTDLSTADARAVLDDLAAAGVRVVIFSGGEPLLRDDIFELLEHAREIGISSQLSSSGIHINEEVAARLSAAGVSYVGVSIDGTRAFNDAYRGMEGAHDRALAGLRHARAAGMRTGVRMTITRRNRHDVEAVLAEAEEVGASRFYLSHLVWSGRGRRLMGDDLSIDESRALLEMVFELADARWDAPTRIVTGSNDSDGPLLLDFIGERYGEAARGRVREWLRRRGGNSAGEKMLAIDHRGRVHPDQFWHGATLGVLPVDRFADVLRHPFLDALRTRERHLTGRCHDCQYLELCRGSHRERALAATGDVWASDPACVLTDDEIQKGTSCAH